ncbi:Homeodomain-like DNA binding domain-containing transcription factor [Phycomyces blakesleeanus NRRL 1555(-)]|uniref:Homeodomain-like DNA binding domain-containing transcription factor n=1 Tax=Phycomyces blakesleeanus (strain ATCC 8743b / DSM 1359 / FGSC 10004 / NBRC 33097 / NRRL 1555) TaxID=763407 RepID=A0A167PC68_PHYB8|nr:Homeodomain-like DNA binding domain-containing transcription factor [Phycomyces blakesleeanus NRRL 1555(-)]OAD77647.1 Homeodomain-like DNA binding domain-containing transcription factor [Phycomyces blakesleeanus NRRL 1555(-)]|eukprot:XP_018295687.1 Homeodomain-like DNA binding domain-containing transcription factor [Phycomyces blakesleeanus NRRL 1555(-)]
MQDVNSSENTHGSYEKANPYKYGCIMYMHLANYGATQISLVVGMSLSTVKYIIKRVDETGSPEPRKGSGRPRKIDERTERHLVQIVLFIDGDFIKVKYFNSDSKVFSCLEIYKHEGMISSCIEMIVLNTVLFLYKLVEIFQDEDVLINTQINDCQDSSCTNFRSKMI